MKLLSWLTCNNDKHPKNRGFTLVELLVALGMFSIVFGAIISMFITFSRQYTRQNVRANLQQLTRSAVGYMAREITMAGFTPVNDESFGITDAQSRSIEFTVDWDSDGKVTESHAGSNIPHESDIIQYVYIPSDGSLRRGIAPGTGAFSRQTLIGGPEDDIKVTNLMFSYLDEIGDVTTVANNVRTVVISLTARAPAGRDGFIEKTYIARVRSRNLGI